MKRLLVCVLAFVMLISGAASYAEAKDKTVAERRQEINKAIKKAYEKDRDIKNIAKALEKYGVRLVSDLPESGDVTVLSDGSSDVTFSGPYVFFDDQIQQYSIYFDWAWNDATATTKEWQDDQPFPCTGECNMGGTDAFGIHISNDTVLRLMDQVVYYYDQFGNYRGEAYNPVFNSGANGAVIEIQDTWNSWDNSYTLDHGHMTIWMEPTGTHVNDVAIRAHYAHTWQSTDITGGSLSTSGITINFSSTDAKWHVQGRTITYYDF